MCRLIIKLGTQSGLEKGKVRVLRWSGTIHIFNCKHVML